MTSRLVEAKEKELLAIAYAMGGLAFPDGNGREWFRKRFHMFEETIRDTWIYQEFGKDFFQKGIEKGIEKGELQGLRQAVLAIVRGRFPEIEATARQQVEEIKVSAHLQQLVVKMSVAKSIQEAALALLNANEDAKKH
jgi:hypothetical protein